MTSLDSARALLCVPELVSAQELGDALRREGLRAHPDSGGSLLQFRAVLNAYSVLMQCQPAMGCSLVEGQRSPSRPRKHPAKRSLVVASSKAPKLSKLQLCLSRLESALRSVPAEERREALDRLKPPVRAALYRHMQAGHSRRGPSPAHCHTPGRARWKDRCYASHLERVQRDTGIYYRVRQGLGPVEARTQYVLSLEKSLDMLVALTRIQASVHAKLAAVCMEDVEQFVGAFESAWLSLTTKPEMQLSFRAVLHCSMRLEGPYTKLRNALHHRLHLLGAAGRGWPFLREALTEMRRSPNKRRLRTLSVTEAAASVDGAYAKRLKARLERASKATELRLEIASKASMAALRRQASAKLPERCRQRSFRAQPYAPSGD